MTVVVEVNESQAVVASLFIDNRQAPRQREGELLPRFLRLGPGEESALFWVGYNQFTTAIPVHIVATAYFERLDDVDLGGDKEGGGGPSLAFPAMNFQVTREKQGVLKIAAKKDKKKEAAKPKQIRVEVKQ